MNTFLKLLQGPTRRVWACAAVTLVAIVTVSGWVARMDGDTSQIAAMLGATIAVTAASVGRRSCRSALLSRGPASTER